MVCKAAGWSTGQSVNKCEFCHSNSVWTILPLYSNSAKLHHQHTTKSTERCHSSTMWTPVLLKFVAVCFWMDNTCIYRTYLLCAKNMIVHFKSVVFNSPQLRLILGVPVVVIAVLKCWVAASCKLETNILMVWRRATVQVVLSLSNFFNVIIRNNPFGLEPSSLSSEFSFASWL